MIIRSHEVSAAPVVEIEHELDSGVGLIVQVYQNGFLITPSAQVSEDKISLFNLTADATVVVLGEPKREARKSSNGSKANKRSSKSDE